MTEHIDPSVRKTERFDGFLIEYGPSCNGYDGRAIEIGFRVLDEMGNELDGTPLYRNADSGAQGTARDFVTDPAEGETFLYGHIKWDECSNWMFADNAKNLMLHFCDRDDPVRIGALMKRLFEIAKTELTGTRIWE